MHPAIEQHRPAIAELCRTFAVRRLDIFGSAARGVDFDPARSDADFLVEFDRESGLKPLDQYFGFSEALEKLLGRKVDLADRSAIESSRNPFLRRQIIGEAQPVYG
jgi:predicted nucleotidyltransferase